MEVVKKIVLALGLLLLLSRFLYPGDIVFIADEPLFQLKIDEDQASGKIPLTSFRGSSIPLAYGAGAIYFYWPLRWFTADPIKIGIYHIFFVSLSALFLYFALRRRYGAEAGAWALFACSASPLLFLFSRHPWDNTLIYPTSALLLYLFSRLDDVAVFDRGAYILLGLLGFVAGYGINIHLMFSTVALGAGFTILYFCWKQEASWQKKLMAVGIFGGVALLTVAPYLWEAFHLMQEENALAASRYKDRWGDGRNLWWIFHRTAIFSSLWGSKVYFQTMEPIFFEYVGPFWTYLFRVDLFGWFGKIAAWSLPFLCIGKILTKNRVSLLWFFVSSSFFLVVLVYQYLNIPTDPHYYNPIWWFAFVGIAAATKILSSNGKKVFFATLVLAATVNVAFLFFSMKFVHENRGARNMFYSTVVGEQMRVARGICAEMARKNQTTASVDISKVLLNAYSFRFHFKHLDECGGRDISVGQYGGSGEYVLRYPQESSTSASLLF